METYRYDVRLLFVRSQSIKREQWEGPPFRVTPAQLTSPLIQSFAASSRLFQEKIKIFHDYFL